MNWLPSPGSVQKAAVFRLLDVTADIIDDCVPVHAELFTEGARSACVIYGIRHEPTITWVGRQALRHLAVVYLRSPWCDHTLIENIVDHIGGTPADVQARLTRIAAIAARQHRPR